MDDKWLSTLKIGDKVVLPGENMYGGDEIGTVIKLTKSQIHVKIVSVLRRFRRDSGRSIGTGTWHTIHLEEATASRIQQIKDKTLKRVLKAKLKNSLDRLSLDVLQKIVHMCNL